MRYLRFSQVSFLGISLIITASAFGQTPTSATRDVALTFTVTDDNGHFASGLGRERFSVFEKNTQLQITSFETLDKPASVVFLFDLSRSMEGRGMDAAVEAIFQFVQKSNQENDYLVVGFDEKITSMTDWSPDRERIRKALREVLQHKPRNNTALYDACDVALKKLESSTYSTHVLLLFSDGYDSVSKLSLKNVRGGIKKSTTTLYTIGLVNGADYGNSLGMYGQSVLDELASVTGGRAYYPRNINQLQDVLDQISFGAKPPLYGSVPPSLGNTR